MELGIHTALKMPRPGDMRVRLPLRPPAQMGGQVVKTLLYTAKTKVQLLLHIVYIKSVKENTKSTSGLPANSEKHANGALQSVKYRATERLGKECSLYIGGWCNG